MIRKIGQSNTDKPPIALKTRLNRVKALLDPINARCATDEAYRRRWAAFQAGAYPYTSLKRSLPAPATTVSWLKFWEIYHLKCLLPRVFPADYRVFFNAALPGASICAFNHWCQQRDGRTPQWVASSLVGGLRDEFGVRSQNPTNWLMTESNNGDMTRADNIRDLAARLGQTINLYIHDADVCDNTDYDNQEVANARLQFGCAVAGFATMKVGANFVGRCYTCFEPLTHRLLRLCQGLFAHFYMCKPLSSRATSSDIYIVGIGFRGISAEMLDSLLHILENFDSLPTEPLFLTDALSFADAVFTRQIRALESNVNAFNRRTGQRPNTDACAEWLKAFPVMPIDNNLIKDNQ